MSKQIIFSDIDGTLAFDLENAAYTGYHVAVARSQSGTFQALLTSNDSSDEVIAR
jgi:hypothetical protein